MKKIRIGFLHRTWYKQLWFWHTTGSSLNYEKTLILIGFWHRTWYRQLGFLHRTGSSLKYVKEFDSDIQIGFWHRTWKYSLDFDLELDPAKNLHAHVSSKLEFVAPCFKICPRWNHISVVKVRSGFCKKKKTTEPGRPEASGSRSTPLHTRLCITTAHGYYIRW